MRTRDDRHTGMPRPLPQLRRPLGLLRRPVEDPRACAARRGNAVHGCVSAASRGGTLLHAQAGCSPPLGSSDRNSKHPDCLQGRRHSALRRGLCGRSHLPYPSAAPDIAKNPEPAGRIRRLMRCHVLPIPIHFNGLPDRAAVPTKNSLKSAKSTCRTSSHIPGFWRGFGSPYGQAASPYTGAVSHIR